MTVTCPNCSDELDVPASFAGRPVRCGSCQGVFTPPAFGAFAPSPTGRTDAPPNPLWAEAEAESRPTLRPARRRPEPDAPPPRGTAGVWGLALLTLLVTAPCTVGSVWLMVTILFPRFEPAADDTGRFRAAFPGTPVAVNRKDDGGRLVRGFDLHRDFPPEKYFVYYLDLPKAEGKKPEDVLADEAKRLDELVPPGATETRRETTTHDGHPALDVLFDNPDPQAGTVIVRCVLAPSPVGTPRLYIAGLSGQMTTDDPRAKRFFLNFHVGGKK